MKLADLITVVVGAGIGGCLRYAVGGWTADRWGTLFPWHTFAINVVGAFLLGLLMVVGAEKGLVSSPVRLFVGVGVLGGFTTFSTLSYESVALMQAGLYAQGLLNMFGSGAAGLVAAVMGIFLGRAV